MVQNTQKLQLRIFANLQVLTIYNCLIYQDNLLVTRAWIEYNIERR
jgi:hypothetical protein